MRFYTQQIDERDCGVAALSMVLKFYHSQYPLALLRQKAKTDMEGTTVLGIIDAAKSINIKAEAFKADMSLFNMSEIKYPFIAHVVKGQKNYHYYTIFDSDEKNVFMGDPDSDVGIKKISKTKFFSEWTGICIFFEITPKYKIYKYQTTSLKKYFTLVKKEKNIIIRIITFSLFLTLITIAGSYFLQFLIDDLIPKKEYSFLLIISLGLIVGYLAQSLFSYVQGILITIFGQKLASSINLNYIKHLFHLPISFFSTRRTGEITSRFTDTSDIIDALGSSVISILIDSGMIIVVGISLLYQNFNLFMVSIISIPIYFALIITFSKRFDRLNQEVMEDNAMLNSSIIESIKGIESVKSFNEEEYSYNKIQKKFFTFLNKNLSYAKADILQSSLKNGVDSIFHIIILWFGARMIMNGDMLLGQLMTYNTLLTYVTEPMLNILNLQPKLQKAKVANDRLNEVFLIPAEDNETKKISERAQIKGNISIDNLSFHYGYSPLVLDKINLVIHENEKIAIVGMSGSGKTTLAKLLVNFWNPNIDSGKIKFNNIDIQNINLKTLRKYITYVPQEPYIFQGTIYDNLVFENSKNITNTDLKNAVATAQIKKDIESLPLGYQTELSEDGISLSAGQKQRLSIARTLLTSAQVIILDESTSNLDAITENKILTSLMQLKDKTIIFIAHRLSIAQKVNNIVVLDHGKIVEHGTHLELLKNKNTYFKLQKNNSPYNA